MMANPVNLVWMIRMISFQQDLDLEWDHAPDRAQVWVLDLNPDLHLNQDRDSDLDPTQDPAPDLDQDLVMDLDPDLDLDQY